MTQRSRSTLFLIEQLVVIAVFAICAVACISILTASYFNARDTSSTGHAIPMAESGAEIFKATGGDYAQSAYLLGGIMQMGDPGTVVITVYYDEHWKVSIEAHANYVLYLVIDSPRNPEDYALVTGELTLERITGEELISFPVAARKVVEING